MERETGLMKSTVGDLIKSNFKSIQSVLPAHMTAERMARLALIEIRRSPDLEQSDPKTLIGALLVASQLGLEIGYGGLAYLIPRWNKTNGCFEANFQLGYKGAMTLARRSGDVGRLYAEPAYSNDEFYYQFGTDPKINHVPAPADRGEITHFYAVANLPNTNDFQFVVMGISEIEGIRDKFSDSAKKGFSPWSGSFVEMGKKTALIRLCKHLPMSAEVQRAIALDEMVDAGVGQNLGAEIPADFKTPEPEPKPEPKSHPRDLMGKNAKPEKEEIDTAVKHTTAQASSTCEICNGKINTGDAIAFKFDDGGGQHLAHENCYLDTQNAKEGK